MTQLGRACLAALLVGAIVTLAACSGGGSDKKASAPDAPTDACGMLTRTRAEAFLGGPVAEPRTSGSTTAGSGLVLTCSYVLASDATKAVAVLLRRQKGQGDDLGAAMQGLKKLTYPGVNTREVSGIGERALWAEPPGLRQLTVLVDDDVLVVSVGPDVTVDATTALARELLRDRPPVT